MDELQVRIVELEPMHVTSVHAYSASPEHDAWDKLIAWAEPKGLLKHRSSYRIFGFNNPSPSPGSPNYGYEFWITIGPEAETEGEAKIVNFPGGRYAVTRCVGIPQLVETWPRLVTWVEDNGHQHGSHQWLEENLSPIGTPDAEMLMDLHMPIR
jgi:DNA gyrase inhibitor GyrI